MTRLPESVMCEACPAHQSTLLFDRVELIAVRLLPAQFARVVGVSKQSVSKWIRGGKVTLGPDGRLDPVTAIQEVLRKTAPTRLRARIFRQAMQGAEALSVEGRALQRKCRDLEAKLTDQASLVAAAEAADHRRRAAAHADSEHRAWQAASAFRMQIFNRFEHLVAQHAQGWDALRWALHDIEAEVLASAPNQVPPPQPHH